MHLLLPLNIRIAVGGKVELPDQKICAFIILTDIAMLFPRRRDQSYTSTSNV